MTRDKLTALNIGGEDSPRWVMVPVLTQEALESVRKEDNIDQYCTVVVRSYLTIPMPALKVILLGISGIGKTCYVKRLLTGKFNSEYRITYGLEVHTLTLNTNCGPLTFELRDPCGVGLGYGCTNRLWLEGAYDQMSSTNPTGATGIIIMFSVTSRLSYKIIPFLHTFGDVPAVLVGTKVDDQDRKVRTKQATYYCKKKGLQYVDISSK